MLDEAFLLKSSLRIKKDGPRIPADDACKQGFKINDLEELQMLLNLKKFMKFWSECKAHKLKENHE